MEPRLNFLTNDASVINLLASLCWNMSHAWHLCGLFPATGDVFHEKCFSLHCLLQEEKTEVTGEDALDTALLEHHVTQSDITRLTMTNQTEDHNAGRFDD